MFQVRGQFDVRMDGKGRLPLPVRLRHALEASSDDRLVLASYDGGLMGFVESRWRRMERRFAGSSIFDRRTRNFLLAFVAGACEVEPDGQGRILLPRSLRTRAGLERRCVFVSYLGLIEIWDADRWAARQGDAVAQLESDGALAEFVVFDADDGGEDL
jgi:MraZ protein